MSGRRRRLSAVLSVAVALSALLAACGQSQSQRPAVARYVEQVNQAESALAQPLATVTSTARNFSATAGGSSGTLSTLLSLAQEQALLGASTRIAALRRRLASIAAPAPAAHLRTLILRLIDGQVSMTREVTQLVAFLPRFQRALLPLGPATTRLESVLSQQSAYGPAAVSALFAAKAAALRRFQGVVGNVARQLRALRPPDVSKPGYRAQLTALDGMAASSGRLAGALVSGDQSVLPRLLADFDRAAGSNQTVGVQRAQIAAVRAYDAKITALAQLSRRVDAERARLAGALH